MTGMDEFISFFGNITLEYIIRLTLAILFLFLCYKEVKKFFKNRYEIEMNKKKKFDDMADIIKQYKEDKESIIGRQKELFEEIQSLKTKQIENSNKLNDMQEDQRRRERNKLRDRLLQSYRYYTNIETNPKQVITKMESEAFWDLFRDYEDAGGDGYMHTVVQPKMNLLKVIDVYEK